MILCRAHRSFCWVCRAAAQRLVDKSESYSSHVELSPLRVGEGRKSYTGN